MSNFVSDIFKSVGGFLGDQVGNAWKGLTEGFTGSANPGSPDEKANEPLMENLFEGLGGGVKNNWLGILGSILSVFAFNKTLGRLVPSGWGSVAATIGVGLLSFFLINNFTKASNDNSPAEPVAKVNLTTGPRQNIPAPVHRDFSGAKTFNPEMTYDHS